MVPGSKAILEPNNPMTPHKSLHKDIVLTSVLTLGLIFADQLTKFLAVTYLDKPISLLGDFFALEKSFNPGIAFGIRFNQQIILFVTILLVVLIIQVIRTEINLRSSLAKAVVALVLSGAISNLLDRLTRGEVVDFLAFSFWPAFNLADAFIVVGVILTVGFYKKIAKR